MINKEFCIIGIDDFGLKMAENLKKAGINILLVDNNAELVNSQSSNFSHLRALDATNLTALKSIDIDQFSAVIVCVSTMENSILIVSNLKQLKVRNIIAKVKSDIQKKVLSTIAGSSIDVIWPEESVAQMLSFSLAHDLDINLNSENNGIVTIQLPVKNNDIFNKTVEEIEKKHKVTLISISRENDVIFPLKSSEFVLRNDLVSLSCKNNAIDEIAELFTKQ